MKQRKGPTCPVRAPDRGKQPGTESMAVSWTLRPTGLASLPRARMSKQKAQGPSGPPGAWEREANVGGPRLICSPVKGEEKPPANPRRAAV